MTMNSLMFSLVRGRVVASLFGLSLLMTSVSSSAAPYAGEHFELRQPDGSHVPVVVYGDEFHQHIESAEGYTLVRDKDGWICYAKLNADATDLVTTGIRYTGAPTGARSVSAMAMPVTKHVKLPPFAIKEKVSQVKSELNSAGDVVTAAGPARLASSDPSLASRVGTVKGLTLLIEFSDEVATVEQTELDDFCNLPGYDNFGNNGSIRDYFFDASNGKLEYGNEVTAYYMAAHPKSYYDSTTVSYGSTARELILEALTDLDELGFDFSTLSTDSNGNLLVLNVLYAGSPDWGWSKGLWPHSWSLSPIFSADGVNIDKYQITNIGTSLSIGTFIHENGHELCGWPDLYDYGYDSAGVGDFDVMAYGGSNQNPVPPNAYFREICGWETPVDITNATPGTVFTHTSNSGTSFRYSHPTKANEFFIIESRRIADRNASLPDEGLMIWHVDTNGSNDYQAMTPSLHYLVSLEQADGQYHLENNSGHGDSNDLFDGVTYNSFTDGTVPDSGWWNGDDSGLRITNISPLGSGVTTVSFTLDTTVAPTELDVVMTLDSDSNPNDNNVHLAIEMTNQGTTELDLSDYEIVYYLYEPNLDVGDAIWSTYYCNRTGNVSGDLFEMASPSTSGNQKADKELVFSFPSGTLLPAGGLLHLEGALHTLNWQYNFTESDDWSRANEGPTEFIVVIDKSSGEVVYGKNPRTL